MSLPQIKFSGQYVVSLNEASWEIYFILSISSKLYLVLLRETEYLGSNSSNSPKSKVRETLGLTSRLVASSFTPFVNPTFLPKFTEGLKLNFAVKVLSFLICLEYPKPP